MKFVRALEASVLFVLLLLAIYGAHVTFFRINVVFYASMADGLMAAALTGALVLALRRYAVLGGLEKFQLVVIWALAGYAFAISVPTVIDRSLSFYILEKIQQRGGGIRHDRFAEVFTQEYMKEHRLVDVRLTEQLESGTIEMHNGCVRITEKGRRLAGMSRYFRQNWLPKQRLLMGQYSDDLTDPFRQSNSPPDYTCQ
jgi:hypothetical protein